ncbi:ATPase [Antarcticibacterium sp. 1MA-6-2]|uniref:TrkH family potassium uptake protein n=1 Tax=Antarcticibacterium sp. 1MA-6-2 TaxID=2908210 RepID=UPI001F1B9A69|nr:potassium transporter TrkG [Antarcticibacterium sp. 1MA-6-2]UJH90580.1 ATPase [Antarcticibacterium sp. 1MA-6-2]
MRLSQLRRLSFWLSFLAVGVIVYDLGFKHDLTTEFYLTNIYFFTLSIGMITIITRYFLRKELLAKKVKIFDAVILFLYTILLLAKVTDIPEDLGFLNFFNKMGWVYVAVLTYFVRELSTSNIHVNNDQINPAQLFIGSFLVLILFGTFLLMLPQASYENLSLIDALFTSTSAVCVTGLIVVDTGTYFTQFGQTVILILIQLGGLGIMTFASYFSYFFRGKSSYENQIMLKDVTNSQKIGEVFVVLKKIILLTFSIELIGAVFIFSSLEKDLIPGIFNKIFFSIFHSISAFCNAGFSTLENSLYEPEFEFNYLLQLVIIALFVLGGIGFPLLFNLYRYFVYSFKKRLVSFNNPKECLHLPWVLNLNSRIILVTTGVLLLAGTVLFCFFEYDNTLASHSPFGKFVVSLFGAATPRTAGFNNVDMSALNFSTVMVIFLLMWIGASPGSTGGGIKTTTFALATLNFLSIAKGKDRVEVYRRQVSDLSMRRAFAIMALSLVVIGTAVFLIASFDSEMTLLSIAFECFSAYSTVGLSLGITASLSGSSKLVIIAVMFIGRVSMLTILIALLRRVKHLNYKYPQEEILMN